jgi:hypothetical protein
MKANSKVSLYANVVDEQPNKKTGVATNNSRQKRQSDAFSMQKLLVEHLTKLLTKPFSAIKSRLKAALQ